MGNTLDQHRAAIGGFSACQLSHGWKLSSNRNSVPLKRTERNRRTWSHAVRTTTILVTEVILLVITLSLMTMACPLVQQVFEHALPDSGSFHSVPEQYSIQKEYPKHSVSRKNLFLYSNLRNNFQTNQKLGAFWEKMFLLFSNGVIFTQPCHFQEVFGRYLWNGPSTLKLEKTKCIFFDFDSSSNSLGPPRTLWDSLGPSGTPLGILEGPRGGIKFGVHHIIILSYWRSVPSS